MNLARAALATVLIVGLVTPRLTANQTFAGIHYLVPGADRAEQVKCRIVLTGESVEVHGHRGVGLLDELVYEDIKAATYSNSKHPRWKSGIALAAAVGVFAVPLFFMKGRKHWLTIQAEGHYVALRLSKKNFPLVIAAFESETGLKVERITE